MREWGGRGEGKEKFHCTSFHNLYIQVLLVTVFLYTAHIYKFVQYGAMKFQRESECVLNAKNY